MGEIIKGDDQDSMDNIRKVRDGEREIPDEIPDQDERDSDHDIEPPKIREFSHDDVEKYHRGVL